MKTLRNIFTWVLLAIAGNALAAELTVADFSIMPGQQQEVAVAFNNADYECIMLDFWMSLPEGVTIAKDEDGELMYEESSTRFRKSHSMEVAEKEGNTYHILIFSTKNETLKGTSGTLFTLTLEAAANAPQGQQQGRFYNQIFSDADKQEHNPADVSFNIAVGNSTPAEDMEVLYQNTYSTMGVWSDAAWSISESSMISRFIYDLDMSEEQFNAAYELDATSGTVKQYQRGDITETVGSITYNGGNIRWSIGDWQTVAMRITGADNIDDALNVLRNGEKRNGEGFATYIRYKNKNGNGGDVYVMLDCGVDIFAFVTGAADNKDLSHWYALNSTQSGSKELHVAPPTPTEEGDDSLEENDLQRDLSNSWTQGGPILDDSNSRFPYVLDDIGFSYRFTIPKNGVNATFSASTNGTWTVKGHSGQTYTLCLGEPIVESNGEISYKAIYTDDGVCIARLTGNRIEYRSNYYANDILNYSGRYDADGKDNYSSYMGSGQTFTAYLELYCTGDIPPYGVLLKDPYFNVRFVRPLNVWSNNHVFGFKYAPTCQVNTSDLISVADWRNFTVNLKKKIESSSTSIGYGFYGISEVSTDMNSIMTDLDASASLRDEIASKLSSRSLTQYDIANMMEDLSSASSISSLSSEMSVSNAIVNALSQSVITFTDNGAITQNFHLFVPVTLKYIWGSYIKTWAVITVEPEQQPVEEMKISIADKCPIVVIEDCDDSSWTGTNGLGGHIYETYEEAYENHPATHKVAFNETLDMMSFLDVHYSDNGVAHQPMTPDLFKQKGLQLDFSLVRDNNELCYASIEVFRDPNADFGVSNAIVTPRNTDANGSVIISSPATREVIDRDIIVKVEVVNSDGEMLATGYVRTVITDATSQGDELVTPPAGLQTETYYVNGDYVSYNSNTSSWESGPMGGDLKIGYDGNTVYWESPSALTESIAWVKGTKSGNTITFPSGQYLGKWQGQDLYFVGYDGENVVDIVLEYDSENDEYTLPEGVFILDNGIKDDFYAAGYWVELLMSKTYKTINVQTAGTLSNQISNDEKYKLKGLRLFGNLNSTDFRLLRDMAGSDYMANATQGSLKKLDMLNANVVVGGQDYLEWNYAGTWHIAKKDELGASVFVRCNKLEEVVLPSSLKGILRNGFQGCTNLKHVTFNENLEYLADGAFQQTGVTDVVIPNNLSNMGCCIFYGCASLVSTTIPKNLTTPLAQTFFSCNNLETVISYLENPEGLFGSTDYTAFDYYDSNYNRLFTKATLCVPAGTKSKYENDPGWSKFMKIVEMEGSVPTQVEGLGAENEIQHVYSVEGKMLNNTVRGLNIIRMEDGSIRKVAVY